VGVVRAGGTGGSLLGRQAARHCAAGVWGVWGVGLGRAAARGVTRASPRGCRE
jgi:hypothetical protein